MLLITAVIYAELLLQIIVIGVPLVTSMFVIVVTAKEKNNKNLLIRS
jgi:hypothetical protein